uniref:3-ketoacyl-[acyl-carrier-protein] reductase beta subunit n=1 Tax=Strigamia maritima TaxID=126957 RepID=T1J350_STRMM
MVTVVFGGTGGIGRAIAENFLSTGHKVAILSRTANKLDEAQSYFAEKYSKTSILGLPCDIVNESAVQDSFKTIEAQLGPINVLVNAAGINENSLLIKSNTSSIKSMLDTNLIGPIVTCKHSLKFMLPRKNGCIINIGSVVGVKGNVGQSGYSASKSGLIGFTKSLAKEVGSRGIRVNLIAPGFITTDMTKGENEAKMVEMSLLKRIGVPQDVAMAAQMLSKSNYITGAVIYVDGGLHLNF